MNFKENAERTLREHMAEIQTVKQWAACMGFDSVKYFSRKIRDAFGRRPKQILIETKLRYIEERSSKGGDAILYSIARDAGFDNDAAMYHFIKRHCGKSPGEFRTECQK